MYRIFNIIKGNQQPPHDAGCDAFTSVWLGKQSTDEARKQKTKEKRRKRTLHDKTKKIRDVHYWLKVMLSK